MSAPVRGTQSMVGQMGWVFKRPLLLAIELGWRWIFGIPFLLVCGTEWQKIMIAVPPDVSGWDSINSQNPWQAAVQLAHVWAAYRPHVWAVAQWLAPAGAVVWIVVSGLGRALLLTRLEGDRRIRFRPFSMMAMQAGWLALLWAVIGGWLWSLDWAATTHIPANGEPDLVGFASWGIFLSLGFFTLWALVSWTMAIAPVVMLMERRSAVSSFGGALRLGRPFTGKLVEINMVMGIVSMALVVLSMVLSAAPLPFSDELGPAALRHVTELAVGFYLVSSDYFQVVRLKGFLEFWKVFRG